LRVHEAIVSKLAGELEGAGLVKLSRQHGSSLGYTLLARRERVAGRHSAICEKVRRLTAHDLNPAITLH
jgi:hypothetical protein